MKAWSLAQPGDRLSVLCLGAHSDDIEIGAGGTLIGWMASGIRLDVHWCVASAAGERASEAEASAREFVACANSLQIAIGHFRDGYFPYQGSDIKTWMEGIRARFEPDVILTHRQNDAHQDHREISKLTWNLFRRHLILEYEIPKWDGDMGRPNLYMPLTASTLDRKIALLLRHFGSQRGKDWFDAETFRGLARLRGVECRAAEGYAEAFALRKACLG
jgi:LmbE family N-acetylglucosaminyl deacetylase